MAMRDEHGDVTRVAASSEPSKRRPFGPGTWLGRRFGRDPHAPMFLGRECPAWAQVVDDGSRDRLRAGFASL